MTDSVMRRARFLVLESLYEADSSNHAPEVVYQRRIEEARDEDGELAAAGPSGYGRGLLRGVVKRSGELDGFIQEAATRYPVETMGIVDRNILRLAIWELLTDDSAPVAAVVNEAVELGHRYGGESSPGFINGVLRTVSERITAAHAAAEAQGETLPHPQPPTPQESTTLATVFERVRAIVVEQLGVEEDEVAPNASFVDDLNADSLDLVELIMSLEEAFSGDGAELEISDEDAEKIATVQDAVDYLKDHGIEDK